MTHEEAAAECRAMFNHICIVHDGDLGRLIGFHEDAMDFYYHIRLRPRNALPSGRTEYMATFVGPCVSLAGIDRYRDLEACFTREGCPPADEFIDTTATAAENAAMLESMFGENLEHQLNRGGE